MRDEEVKQAVIQNRFVFYLEALNARAEDGGKGVNVISDLNPTVAIRDTRHPT